MSKAFEGLTGRRTVGLAKDKIEKMQAVVDATRELDALVTGDNYSQVEETELEIALFEALAVYDSYLAALDTSSASVDAEGEKRQEGVRD